MRELRLPLVCVAFGVSMLVAASSSHLHAQEERVDDLLELSFEELMNVEIRTASKTVEDLFDSPMSASVITRAEFERSGASTIPEVLRLVPGLIVREQSPGNFDVHIRGFDNVPPDGLFFESANSLTLVMIDDRVVYNYFTGGTFWESLPVDLLDVERIEVVRGPSAALYGPNAVTGVIHIVTRRPTERGTRVLADVEAGTHNTLTGRLAVDYRPSDALGVTLSAHGLQRDRQQETYWEFRRQILTEAEDVRSVFTGAPLYETAPDIKLASDRRGINAFARYLAEGGARVDLAMGLQRSEVQNIYVDNLSTPFTVSDSKTWYADIRSTIEGFTGQVSLLDGNRGSDNARGFDGRLRTEYDFTTLDVNLEYDRSGERFRVQPGLSYRLARYDAEFTDGEQDLTTLAASLRGEFTTGELRLVGALRVDRYNHPDDLYASWQAAFTYRLGQRGLARLVYSRANRAPFILSTYLHQVDVVPGLFVSSSFGNQNLNLLRVDQFEIGYRLRIVERLDLDLELFSAESRNYDALVNGPLVATDSLPTVVNRYENIPLEATQTGVSARLAYVASERFRFNVFGTVQQTELDGLQPDRQSRPDSLVSVDHKGTPTLYGGVSATYRIGQRWSGTLTGYGYTGQTFSRRGALTDDISGKMIVSGELSYAASSGLIIWIGGRNLLDDSPEFGFADRIGATYSAGARIRP